MNEKMLEQYNDLIRQAYECRSFEDFLRLAIIRLHTLVMYDSGLFFCAISHDSSFFQPYLSGNADDYYQKAPFRERDAYLEQNAQAGSEALVYKAAEYRQGLISVSQEPRSDFLSAQEEYHVVCLRIVYHGQFMGEIYLHRNKDKPDFDAQDLFVLRLLQPHVSTVFHIIHSLIAVKLLEADRQGLDRKGLCQFNGDENLIAANVAGLEILNNSTVFGSSVLYHLKEIMADLYDGCQRSRDNYIHRSARLKTPGSELAVTICLDMKGRKKEDSRFLVSMEFTDEKQLTAEYRFKFTKRETDIIDGVLQGKSNPKIGVSLSLSENTVKTHLQNIFKKTGAASRSELVYLLMLSQKQG